jgi:uncharacterized protein YeeX (DUF496 family)
MSSLTSDGLIVLSLLISAVLATWLWILIKARTNNGIAELPSFLMFGWGGAAWTPSIIVIDKNNQSKEALIAHERVHQEQQRRYGWFKFYFKYLTNKQFRFEMEVEAYKAWLEVLPNDFEKVIWWLLNSYNISKSREEIIKLLKDV